MLLKREKCLLNRGLTNYNDKRGGIRWCLRNGKVAAFDGPVLVTKSEEKRTSEEKKKNFKSWTILMGDPEECLRTNRDVEIVNKGQQQGCGLQLPWLVYFQ